MVICLPLLQGSPLPNSKAERKEFIILIREENKSDVDATP